MNLSEPYHFSVETTEVELIDSCNLSIMVANNHVIDTVVYNCYILTCSRFVKNMSNRNKWDSTKVDF